MGSGEKPLTSTQPLGLPEYFPAKQRSCTYLDIYGIKESSGCLCHVLKTQIRQSRAASVVGKWLNQQPGAMGTSGGRGRNQAKTHLTER